MEALEMKFKRNYGRADRRLHVVVWAAKANHRSGGPVLNTNQSKKRDAGKLGKAEDS